MILCFLLVSLPDSLRRHTLTLFFQLLSRVSGDADNTAGRECVVLGVASCGRLLSSGILSLFSDESSVFDQ